MAKRTTRSKTRTTLAATALMLLFAVVIPWGCELDTSPVRQSIPSGPGSSRPIPSGPDDNDSGESK